MPSLRTLLSDSAPADIGNPKRVLYIINKNLAATSGGQCCLWTVPAGMTSATFEMWGAGGDGAGARCCEGAGGMSGTNGSYAVKTVDTVAGCQFRLCAGGTGCSNCCCGIVPAAFPSYAYDVTAGTMAGCAVGGNGGCNQVTRYDFNGYVCCWGTLSGEGLGDLTIKGTGNIGLKSHYCYQHIYQIVPGGIGSDRMTSAVCANSMTEQGPSIMTSCASAWGGVGTNGRACGGGFCHGQQGGYGVVKVSYT